MYRSIRSQTESWLASTISFVLEKISRVVIVLVLVGRPYCVWALTWAECISD